MRDRCAVFYLSSPAGSLEEKETSSSEVTSLTQLVAEHHTVVLSLPIFPEGWGRELEKKKKENEVELVG